MQRDADWVLPGVLTTSDLQVTAQSPAAMAVNVSGAVQGSVGGNAWLPSGYRLYNDAVLALTIAAADATNPRIDIVVAGINTSTSPYTPTIEVVTGTPAASPVAPVTPSGYIALAQIAVAANATSISNANITDVRVLATLSSPGVANGVATLDANGRVLQSPNNAVNLMQLSTSHGGTADFYGPTTVHGGVGLTINLLAVPAGLTATNA
ncbi:MAG: hypothetical protein ACYCSN_20270, partial [Acidobacteriaceae bacterium]